MAVRTISSRDKPSPPRTPPRTPLLAPTLASPLGQAAGGAKNVHLSVLAAVRGLAPGPPCGAPGGVTSALCLRAALAAPALRVGWGAGPGRGETGQSAIDGAALRWSDCEYGVARRPFLAAVGTSRAQPRPS